LEKESRGKLTLDQINPRYEKDYKSGEESKPLKKKSLKKNFSKKNKIKNTDSLWEVTEGEKTKDKARG